MRAVIQRVSNASVKCESGHSSLIGMGLLVFLGILDSDGEEDIEWLSQKIFRLRIFNDEQGVMNLSLEDTGAEIMIISQFTLFASTRKGNRPSYIKAAPPSIAIPLYEKFITHFSKISGLEVKTGKFGDHMEVSLVNDGPVTIIIDTLTRE